MASKKNLLQSNDVYSKYYGEFRGVDFSSDHTQVHDQRLSYLVNMYRDYQSAQGKALETVAGYRRRFVAPQGDRIYGIHHIKLQNASGMLESRVLVHADTKLYLWSNYPYSVNIRKTATASCVYLGEGELLPVFRVDLPARCEEVDRIVTSYGKEIHSGLYRFAENGELLLETSMVSDGDVVAVDYYECRLTSDKALFFDMNMGNSVSFVFNNRLYILDGKNYLVFDGTEVRNVLDVAFIPTTYINTIPGGENADAGAALHQRNILQPKFKQTFIADGVTTRFYLNEPGVEEISEVKVYGTVAKNYTFHPETSSIEFEDAPLKPTDASYIGYVDGMEHYYFYPEGYAGVEITAVKRIQNIDGIADGSDDVGAIITHCTIACVYDNRVFLSGNPRYPRHVFYCALNNPTFFGVADYFQDGVSDVPVTGIMSVSDTLMVLKGDAQQDGVVYFHTPVETGDNQVAKVYNRTQGLGGIGCLGACTNFLDDPVFVSRFGLEAMGQLSVRLERAVEHRSSMVDAKLLNGDLKSAVLEEWNGYLAILVDGNIFLADSRQRFADDNGITQYEWYYLEGIGTYQDQYTEYRYSNDMLADMRGKTIRYCTACKKPASSCQCNSDLNHVEIPLRLADSVYNAELRAYENLIGKVVNAPDENGAETGCAWHETMELTSDGIPYSVEINYVIATGVDSETGSETCEALLCDTRGNQTGGIYCKARVLRTIDDNLFFGTENGVICSFNTDMRDSSGEIPPQYYSFDGRTIFSGCATKMDCCGIPHLTKNTVKKSTVIKTKSLQTSAAKIKVRTNKKPYAQIARINSSMFSFENMDFSDFSFNTMEQSLFAVKEKEKKWVEKQYFLYSDEYQKPFALYYIAFRYTVAGRYKESK